jgi:hypothetical protein
VKKFVVFISLLFSFAVCNAQFKIAGAIVDFTQRKPLEAVTIYSSSNSFSISDSLGKYSISVRKGDSIWFSFLGKNTVKYPVDTITNSENFEVALHVNVNTLPPVSVRNRSYKMDSLQNRQDYAKVFNFKKPGISLAQNNNYVPGAVSVGLDLDEFINMFRFKHNKRILALQERLLQQEQDKYIDHRFNKRFNRQLTKLNSPDLETFMTLYRPTYELLQIMNDLELGVYIQKCFADYEQRKASGQLIRPQSLSPHPTDQP